jgi:hypothetical protein
MSERIAAEIQIGGKVRRGVAEELCGVIDTERVSLEWGGSPFVPRTVDELLAARYDNGDGLLTLRLYDYEASWGEFDDLEEFLREHKIPFVRYTERKYDCDPEVVGFHPICGHVQELTDHNRNPTIQAATMKPIADSLARILAGMRNGKLETEKLQLKLKRLHGKLHKCLPPDVPALETFEIIEEPRRRSTR